MIKLNNISTIALRSCLFDNHDFLNDFWKQVVPGIADESSQAQVT